MYRIDFNTGAGNKDGFECIGDAEHYADYTACYTTQNIDIYDDFNELVAERKWYGVPLDDELGIVDDPINFGNYGYYDDWEEY